MAAIAGVDDVHAWLIRGFVEAGLPDQSGEWREEGVLNLENFASDRGASGILLEFCGQAGPEPVQEDQYTYQVVVVREPTGGRVVARCAETLFHHSWPDTQVEALAAHILGHIRQHNTAFTAWRAAGGEVTWSERAAIPEERGSPCTPALAMFLAKLRRERTPLASGPAKGWWANVASPAAVADLITVGKGIDPAYRTRPSVPAREHPENLAYIERVRTVGLAMIVSGVLSALFVCVGFAWTGWGVAHGLPVLSQGWGVASVLMNVLFAVAQIFAGWRARSLQSRLLVQVLAVIGMLPCFAPCCATGLPVGIWALLVLRNPRALAVFQ